MIQYLRGTSDEVRKADAVKRIADLAERFAPDPQWYIDTMNQVRLSHRQVKAHSQHTFREQDDSVDSRSCFLGGKKFSGVHTAPG